MVIKQKIKKKRAIVRQKRQFRLQQQDGIAEDSKLDFGHVSGAELSYARARAQKQKLERKMALLARKGEYDDFQELEYSNLMDKGEESDFLLNEGSRAGSKYKKGRVELRPLPMSHRMVYTDQELHKLYDKTSMRFFNSTNKYGLTPAQEKKIKSKMESRRPPPTVISNSSMGKG